MKAPRLAVTLALAALLLAAGRLVLEGAAEGRARAELERLGLAPHARFQRLEASLPTRLGAAELELLDPWDGAVVGRLAELAAEFAPGPAGGLLPAFQRVVGRGGRAEIRTGADDVREVPFVRAISGLVSAILEATPDTPDDVWGPLVALRDIEAVVWAPGQSLLRYPLVDVEIQYDGTRQSTPVRIRTVDDGGELVLTFVDEGLAAISTRDLRVGPALALILGGEWGPALGALLGASGRLDLDARGLFDGEPSFHGELRDAVLEPPGLPFPLDVERLAFELRDGQLRIEPTRVHFPDGVAQVSVGGTLDHVLARLAIPDARFRASLLGLLPSGDDLGGFGCADDGSYELFLELETVGSAADGEVELKLTGRGGVHISQLWWERPRLEIHDLLGRFEVRQDELVLTDLSATLGGGRVRGAGLIGLSEGSFDLSLSAEDIDVGVLHDAVHGPDAPDLRPSGYLQGDLSARGRFDDLFASEATGQFSVRAGRFMETSLLMSIFRSADVDGVEPRDDQRIVAAFQLLGRRLFLDPLAVDLGSLGLTGSGWVDERGGLSLDLVLVRDPGGVLGDLLAFLQRNLLLAVEVRGTLAGPTVRTYPVAVLTRSLTLAVEFLAGMMSEAEAAGGND